MSRKPALFLMGLLASSCFAQGQQPGGKCQYNFTVVREDALHNVTEGLSKNQRKWFEKKIQEKYPDVCYEAPDSTIRIVFFITDTPSVYHGTRVITSQQTESNPVDATVTDDSGNTSQVSGRMTTTSHSSYSVPYSVKYGIYMLTVELKQSNGTFKPVHRFQQDGLYRRVYGIPFGKGHHPTRAVVEAAVKWIHGGGLTDPLESLAP